nr:LacI family DNA-binding transcriptional regulator [uncultured Bifidobacterium sp.]
MTAWNRARAAPETRHRDMFEKKGGDKMVQSSVSQRVNRSKRLVSIKDIAKETGVSVCTVSLVMNNKDHNRVSKAVAQKIRATAENMGYKPNSVARTLRTSKSNTLGFVTDEIATTPYASKVLEGAQDAASKLGYILLTTNTNNDAELENQEISALLRYNVDGFLYAMMFHRKVDIPEVLEGSPTVVVDSEDAAGRVPSVYPDDELAGYDATNRLIQAGCRRIVYYGSATSIVAQEQRLTGYRRALAEAGIPFDDALVVEVSEFTNADDEAARVFDEIKPDGIFCFNDVRATFIYEAARERGVRIGADVSVISIDNQPFITNVIKPSLTTLELPHYEMGFEAVRQLVTILDGDKAVADLESDRGMAVQRQRDGSRTALRCRIIERDSIVS